MSTWFIDCNCYTICFLSKATTLEEFGDLKQKYQRLGAKHFASILVQQPMPTKGAKDIAETLATATVLTATNVLTCFLVCSKNVPGQGLWKHRSNWNKTAPTGNLFGLSRPIADEIVVCCVYPFLALLKHH